MSDSIELSRPPDAAREAGEVARFLWRGEDMNVAGSVIRSDAGLVISRAEITAQAAAGVTHHLLRKVPLGSLLAEARAHVAANEPPALEAPSDGASNTGSGYVAMTDDHLRKVAMAYLRETAPGKDRAAISRMEQEFGRPRGTILTWITRARKEGWLGPAVRGRLGSEPGPKLNAYAVEEGIDEPEPLRRPNGLLTDDFLRRLSAAYLELAMKDRAPAPAIARQTGAPVRTVHRWIAEARKRGHLPPGRRGRVG